VSHRAPNVIEEVERYVLTGSSDPLCAAWSGNIVERATCARDQLRVALVRATKLREAKATRAIPGGLDPVALRAPRWNRIVHISDERAHREGSGSQGADFALMKLKPEIVDQRR
jgi:hypothetical protein